ncbi:MAG: hypothetical protein ABIG95_01675 [Candidatus Woesearchaeota archaeon]
MSKQYFIPGGVDFGIIGETLEEGTTLLVGVNSRADLNIIEGVLDSLELRIVRAVTPFTDIKDFLSILPTIRQAWAPPNRRVPQYDSLFILEVGYKRRKNRDLAEAIEVLSNNGLVQMAEAVIKEATLKAIVRYYRPGEILPTDDLALIGLTPDEIPRHVTSLADMGYSTEFGAYLHNGGVPLLTHMAPTILNEWQKPPMQRADLLHSPYVLQVQFDPAKVDMQLEQLCGLDYVGFAVPFRVDPALNRAITKHGW